jgi:hypothetical protein
MAEDPGKASVSDLMKSVRQGKFVIPYFQRGFEWEKWDSVWGAEETNTPEKAILDGQQRISSLYYAISNPETKFPNRKTYYRWFLDIPQCLSGEVDGSVSYTYSKRFNSLLSMRENREAWIERGSIPLAILSDPNYLFEQEFADWAERFIKVQGDRSRIPESTTPMKIVSLLQRILNYEFITTTLSKDREMRDICNIFARINKKGLNLSTFDLMNAFLYPHGIELRKRWENLDNRKLKKLISLHVQNYCSSKYIYNLIPGETTEKKTLDGQSEEVVLVKSAEEFDRLWNTSLKYGDRARERIMNVGNDDFGAIKSKFIPNTTIVPVLGALLWEKEKVNVSDREFNELLTKWYWSATLSEDYSGSSDTTMAKDFRDWKQWFKDRTPVERASRVDEQFIENELDFRSTTRGSRYDAVLCMLALNGARDFFTGRPLHSGEYVADRIDDHHIFPSQVRSLDPAKSQSFDLHSDSILNRTLLLDATNKNAISNKRPSVYLQEMMEQGKVNGRDDLASLMADHLISPTALDYLLDDDFDRFIVEREKTVKQHISALIDA